MEKIISGQKKIHENVVELKCEKKKFCNHFCVLKNANWVWKLAFWLFSGLTLAFLEDFIYDAETRL